MIVIPMAGDSSRFKKAGYEIAKFMLPLDGRTLFDWTTLSFSDYFSSETFLFVARSASEVKSFLAERIHALGIKHAHCVFIDKTTRGQAETVYIGLQQLSERGISVDEEPITIFNIDTIRPHIFFPKEHRNSAWLEVFQAKGDSWSFMLPEANGSHLVKRCAEKIRISDYCCTGLYSFKNIEQFMRAYHIELNTPSSHELFIAPMYNHLIDGGEAITWHEIDASLVLLSGVPDEYMKLNSVSITSYFART